MFKQTEKFEGKSKLFYQISEIKAVQGKKKSLKHIKSCWVSRSRSQVKPWGSELVWKAHNSVGGKILHIRESERTSLKYNTLNKVVMLIYNKNISVSPLTTHIPLKNVHKIISKNRIINHVKKIHNFSKNLFKINSI